MARARPSARIDCRMILSPERRLPPEAQKDPQKNGPGRDCTSFRPILLRVFAPPSRERPTGSMAAAVAVVAFEPRLVVAVGGVARGAAGGRGAAAVGRRAAARRRGRD